MKTVKISLNSIDKVKSFVNDITKFDMILILYPEDMSSMQNQSWESSA